MNKKLTTSSILKLKKIYNYPNPNYLDKLARIYNWIQGYSDMPYKATIILTNRCNLNCFACPNAASRYQKNNPRFMMSRELSDEQWKSTIRQGLSLGVKEWYFMGGGEPTLKQDILVELIEDIKTNSVYNVCEIITNGTLLTEENIKRLVELRLDNVIISIDSHKKETHDYLRNSKGAKMTYAEYELDVTKL